MNKLKYLFWFTLGILAFSCENFIVKPASSNRNMEDFEVAWNRINDVYPFFELKNIHWDSIYMIYHPLAEAARGDEFYFVLHDLLAELKDGHVYYQTDGGGEVYPFYPQRHFKDRHAYSPFVVRKYFDKALILTVSETVEYGILPDNIGYIFLAGFHEEYLIKEFADILEFLKNTKGLIIDIRQKRGGSYQNVETVVTRFMTEPLERPNLYFLGELFDAPPFQPQGPFAYTNPVALLINGSTFSAGELTSNILKQLPNVTAIGDTTGGGGGAGSNHSQITNSDYRLPSGKLISTPTGFFERYDGQPFEWLGVPPDIRIEQTDEDIVNGRDKILEFAINMLK